MSHAQFLESLLIKSAFALATAYFLGFIFHFDLSYMFAAAIIVLVISISGLYHWVAGGYRISDSQIQDTLKEMRD